MTRSASDDATVRVGDGDAAETGSVATPTRLGRYVVVEEVGAGGMGRVLRAYDPKLRREVALKVLAPRMQESEGAARIVREAQAMAQLSHPNLVPVYDVDQDSDALFIAMEYVEGDTLRRWLATPRTWQEVVHAFLGAGRGLAAAHAAGIVHRDFKPSNAIVATDGRVRVMDFGLARGVVTRVADSLEDVEVATLSELTQAGVVIGTLPYMAPEQHDGVAALAASDQYAFCVALFEGLFGERPFIADHAKALVAAKRRGMPAIPSGSRVPRWLQAAVLRGLAVEPHDRWPNMEALLSALERGQVRRGARMGLAAASAIGLAIGAGVIVHELDVRRRTSACGEAGAEIDAVWNEERRTHLRDALAAGGTVQATTTAQKVIPWIDDQAQAWQNARTEACIDHDVREVWDGDTLARSLWCLDERRMELESLVDELVRADVAFAVSAAARLTSVDGCRDRDVLARLPPPPTEHVEDIRAIRAQLARATAHERTGEYADALVLADSTREDAEALGWPPLVAAAWTQEAILREREGDYEDAARLATRAYFEAARVDAWDEAARAASELIYVVGYRLARFDEGRIWAEHTAIALAHTGDPGQLQEAARSHRLALVEFASGDFAQARMLHERGLELQQDALGPDHPGLAGGLANLANVHARMNDHAQARALHERALAIREQALGPVHHAVATSLNDLAAVYFSAGEHAAARPLFERSLAIDVAVLGPDHPDVAVSLMNVGIVHIESDEADEAKALFEQALAIFEKSLGPDHPNVASCLVNLASVHARRGEHGRARAALERALAIQEKSLGPDHVDLARSFGGLAEVHAAAGEIEQALARGKQALALREDALGSDHPDVAATLVGVAENLLAVGDADAATRALERAMAIYERHEGVQQGEPEAQRMLAKARARVRGERQRSPK